MHDRSIGIFAEKPAHPTHPFAAHDMVGVDHVLDARNSSHKPAHHDH